MLDTICAHNLEPSDDQLFHAFDIYNDRKDFQSAKKHWKRNAVNPLVYCWLIVGKIFHSTWITLTSVDMIQLTIKLNPGNEEISMLQQEFTIIQADSRRAK